MLNYKCGRIFSHLFPPLCILKMLTWRPKPCMAFSFVWSPWASISCVHPACLCRCFINQQVFIYHKVTHMLGTRKWMKLIGTKSQWIWTNAVMINLFLNNKYLGGRGRQTKQPCTGSFPIETGNSMQVSCVGGKSPVSHIITFCFPGLHR